MENGRNVNDLVHIDRRYNTRRISYKKMPVNENRKWEWEIAGMSMIWRSEIQCEKNLNSLPTLASL